MLFLVYQAQQRRYRAGRTASKNSKDLKAAEDQPSQQKESIPYARSPQTTGSHGAQPSQVFAAREKIETIPYGQTVGR